jgi:hypothetical protein
MPKICYVEKNFRKPTLDQIATANAIIDEYAAQGFDLTLRQLYYQMVARGYIENSERSYKNFGNVIDDGRLAGLIDWDHIVDRTRNLRGNSHFRDPAHIMTAAVSSFQIDKWGRQPYRVEVWVEKDALIGVVEVACRRLDVPFFACRGYTSQSEMWGAAQRLKNWRRQGQTPVILYLGDHDPSGIDMTRDVADRMTLFAGGLKVDRLALNWNQVERYNPPPNPAKLTDSRAEGYIAKFGLSSWELDALDPTTLAGLIETAVETFRDEDLWSEAVEEEEEGLRLLQDAADRWGDVADFLQNES